MSVLGNALLLGGDAGTPSYTIDRSVRLRSSASAYFNRTPASQPTTWTCSFWIKRGKLGAAQAILVSRKNAVGSGGIEFTSGDNLNVFNFTSNGTTSAVYRDCSAWYHFVVVWSGTSAAVVYCNGVQQTMSSNTSGSSNIFTSTWTNCIGNFGDANTAYFDGYLTEINFIDGQALTPSSFGETDTTTGVWKPKAYNGTYGTNGFFLKFADNSAATAAAIGKDSSGNGNNWTPNNISVTAGVTYDSMTDVPTLTNATTANYCVINPLGTGVPSFKNATGMTITNANLTYSKSSGSGYFGALGSIAMPSSGKWYWEFVPTTGNITSGISVGADYASSGEFGIRVDNTSILVNGSATQTGLAGLTTNDVVGCTWDADTNSFQFYKNGSSYGASVSFTPTTGASYYPYLMNQGSGVSTVAVANFGQRPFTYTPPTGFKALNTQNLPDSTIPRGNRHFDVTLATGNNSTQVITNSGGFQPDFVWMKIRSSAENHIAYDSVRGVQNYLVPNLTLAEASSSQGLTSFNSNGFTLGNINPNYAGSPTFVAWQWRASNAAAVSNTAGSITSQVSANVSAGFSIVTYTSQASGVGTIGHGLGVAPAFIINKPRTGSVAWTVYHQALGNNAYLILNTTAAQTTGATTVWNSTSPSSTVFTQGSAFAGLGTMVAYCFSEVQGYSKAFSYTGNGSADGVFSYLGFKPRMILLKRTDTTGNWYIWDTARNTYNVLGEELYPNLSNAAASATDLDVLSNGIKLRNSTAGFNASGGTYIGFAWASNPFKNSLAF